MTDDNIVSIVQVPGTFYAINNRDKIAVSDDLAKMLFPFFEKNTR